MSRINPCQHDNVSNFQKITLSKFMKKTDSPRPSTRERPICRTVQPVNIIRPQSVVPRNAIVPVKTEISLDKGDQPLDKELVHKEYLNNRAQVEVTVRTVSGRSRSNSVDRTNNEWGKYRMNNDCLSCNYDYAIGTIHYLSKELQHKLQSTCPGDPSLQQIVNDIQHTLYRISPEPTADNIMVTDNGDAEYFLKKEPKFKRTNSTQTLENHLEIYDVYEKLKDEKENVEIQYLKEKEGIEKLNQDLKELEDKNDQSISTIQKLEKEKEELEVKLQENKIIGSSNQELQTSVQKLKDDNQAIEYENMSMKHDMTIMKLEKEKMTFLLESRDKQLNALRNEMEGIQNFVCSQLGVLKSSCTNIASRTSIDSKIWKPKSHKVKNIQELYNSKYKFNFPDNVSSVDGLTKKETCSTLVKSKCDFHDEYPQRDTSMPKDSVYPSESKIAPSELTIASEMPDFETNIRDMFAELKKQALEIALPQPSCENFVDAKDV